MVTPYLERPPRSEKDALFERDDMHNRRLLAEQISLMHNDLLQRENSSGLSEQQIRNMENLRARIHALEYALRRLTEAAAERLKP